MVYSMVLYCAMLYCTVLCCAVLCCATDLSVCIEAVVVVVVVLRCMVGGYIHGAVVLLRIRRPELPERRHQHQHQQSTSTSSPSLTSATVLYIVYCCILYTVYCILYTVYHRHHTYAINPSPTVPSLSSPLLPYPPARDRLTAQPLTAPFHMLIPLVSPPITPLPRPNRPTDAATFLP